MYSVLKNMMQKVSACTVVECCKDYEYVVSGMAVMLKQRAVAISQSHGGERKAYGHVVTLLAHDNPVQLIIMVLKWYVL